MLVEDQPIQYLVHWFVALPGGGKEESVNSYALDFDKFRNYALKRRISNPAKRLHNLH